MDNEPINQEQQIQPGKMTQPNNHRTLLIILVSLVVCLLGVVGIGTYLYLNQIKCTSSTTEIIEDTNTSAPVTTTGLLSNDIYKIYVSSRESNTVNGDSCNSVSVLTLYNSNNMAVLSNSSCLGTETRIGTYSISSSKTSIQFTALIDSLGYHDSSSNPPIFTINSDGTVSSSLFDAGSMTYVKE